MAQHLMIAELGAPLILVGLRAPVIYFFLPKPAMVWLAHRRTLRKVMRKLTTPIGAIATYAIVLYGWHFAPAFEAALHNPFVHALQHESFFVIAILVWIPALEPTRRRLRGELWKAGHIMGARLVGMFLGAAFIVMRTPAYDWYVGRTAEHGDQPARGPADRGRPHDERRPGDHPVRRRLLLLPLRPGPRPRGGRAGALRSSLGAAVKGLRLDEPAADRVAHELHAVAHAELAEDVGAVRLDRLLRELQRLRDLPVGVGLGDQLDDLELARGERRRPASSRPPSSHSLISVRSASARGTARRGRRPGWRRSGRCPPRA